MHDRLKALRECKPPKAADSPLSIVVITYRVGHTVLTITSVMQW